MGRGLSRFAIEAGVTDIAKFETCLDDQSPVKAIEADLAAARDLGAAGTPTVLINGLMLQTGFDSLSLARAVEQQLRISTDGAAR
jgi:protein-disulfide isomerase